MAALRRLMPDSPATLTARAIAIGRELVSVCDALGQSAAGNHIMMGLDILAAQRDLLIETERSGSSNRVAGQVHALASETDKSSPAVELVGHSF